MRGWTGAFAGAGLLVTAAACASPAPDAIGFSCRVEGAKLLEPAATDEAVCARVKAALDGALGAATRPVADADGADWVRVEVRFRRPGIASMKATRAQGGEVVAHPELNIAVSDRPLGLDTVDRLAREMTGQLTG